MAVPAVRAKDRILTPKMCAHAHRDRFLPDVRMARAGNEPALMRFCEPLLAQSDREHLAVEREEVGVGWRLLGQELQEVDQAGGNSVKPKSVAAARISLSVQTISVSRATLAEQRWSASAVRSRSGGLCE